MSLRKNRRATNNNASNALCLLLFYLKGEGEIMTREIKDAAVVTGQQTAMNAERVAEVLMQFAEAFGASVEQVQEALMFVVGNVGRSTSMTAEEVAAALNCLKSHSQVVKPIHKLNFNRPRIVHQVFNRKPRSRVNKIIR